MLKKQTATKNKFHIMSIQASNQATQTMVINHVLQTNDYAAFKHIVGNRTINKLHVFRLKQSFQKEYLLSPIIVNQEMQIIDGQHRFEAAKDLGLPIRYFICNDYGLAQVQMLNANTSNWKKVDYLNAYCDLGKEQYLLFRDFMAMYPTFSFSACEALLTGMLTPHRKTSKNIGTKTGSYRVKGFEAGEFIVTDYYAACDAANKLLDIKPLFKDYHRFVFILTMVDIFKNPNYEHQRMLQKLKANPNMLQVGTNVTQTKLLIEEIYNYRSQDKVSLRFS